MPNTLPSVLKEKYLTEKRDGENAETSLAEQVAIVAIRDATILNYETEMAAAIAADDGTTATAILEASLAIG